MKVETYKYKGVEIQISYALRTISWRTSTLSGRVKLTAIDSTEPDTLVRVVLVSYVLVRRQAERKIDQLT